MWGLPIAREIATETVYFLKVIEDRVAFHVRTVDWVGLGCQHAIDKPTPADACETNKKPCYAIGTNTHIRSTRLRHLIIDRVEMVEVVEEVVQEVVLDKLEVED